MTGAADLFFSIIMVVAATALLIFGAISIAMKCAEWSDKRSDKKLRFWLLGIFDTQLDYLKFAMEREGRDPKPYGLEFSHLRWELAASAYFFRDLKRFEKGGAPILLVFPKESDRPSLYLGVSERRFEVSLGEGTVFNSAKPRMALSDADIATLKDYNPYLPPGDAFTAVHVFRREDDDGSSGPAA